MGSLWRLLFSRRGRLSDDKRRKYCLATFERITTLHERLHYSPAKGVSEPFQGGSSIHRLKLLRWYEP